MNKIIKQSVINKNIIKFTYNKFKREVEPYCYGISKKGNQVLRGYQIDGESSTEKYGWKLFDVSKIDDLQITDRIFSDIRKEYSENDKSMSLIYCQIERK